MGNSASKKAQAQSQKEQAQVEQLHKDQLAREASQSPKEQSPKSLPKASSSPALTLPPPQFNVTKEELESRTLQEIRLQIENETLQKKCAELQTLSASLKELERERERQIAKLEADASARQEEILGLKRVADARSLESHNAKKALALQEEKVKEAEERSRNADRELIQRRREQDTESRTTQAAFAGSKREALNLTDRLRVLEQEHQSLSTELTTTKTTAAEELLAFKTSAAKELDLTKSIAAAELTAARIVAAKELTLVKSTAAADLAAAHTSAEERLAHLASTSASEIAAAKSQAAAQLEELQAFATSELSTLSSSTSSSAEQPSRAYLLAELADTKEALSAAISRLEDMRKANNESVTRRAASFEAFTATKRELADTQERYLALFDLHARCGSGDGGIGRSAGEMRMKGVAVA